MNWSGCGFTKSPRLARTCAFFFLVASCGAPARLPEQSNGDASVAAKVLYDEGKQYENDGHYEEAYEKYKRSYTINENVAALKKLAKLLDEKLGRPASAWVEYDRLMKATKDDRESETYKNALQRSKEIWAASPKLTVSISEDINKLTDVAVLHNGRRLDKDLWNKEIPADRGEHHVDVSAKGKKPRRQSVRIIDENQRIEITGLEDLDPPYLAYTVGGAGLAVLAVGGVFAGLASSQWDDAIDACNPLVRSQETACKDESHRSAATPDGESAHTKAIIATAAFVTGAAALGTGIALYFTYSPPAPSPNVSELKINPFVFGVSDWGVGVRGKF